MAHLMMCKELNGQERKPHSPLGSPRHGRRRVRVCCAQDLARKEREAVASPCSAHQEWCFSCWGRSGPGSTMLIVQFFQVYRKMRKVSQCSPQTKCHKQELGSFSAKPCSQAPLALGHAGRCPSSPLDPWFLVRGLCNFHELETFY